MNHIRCCASDNGIESGRGFATSAGRRTVPPGLLCTRTASDSTVGASNNARTLIVVSRAELTRAVSLVALSESPPRSKKLESIPTPSIPSTSPKMSAMTCSVSLRGARESPPR